MSSGLEKVFSVRASLEETTDSGIFNWDVENNVVFADSALATLFGLDPQEAKHGLPIETYLVRVHPEDKAGLSQAITETIVADVPQQHVYRVMGTDGKYTHVASFGRAFHRKDGSLAAYAGIVVPAVDIRGQSKQ
ncbi:MULTISPECIES: PAS domain-containing protein [unclassified Rhizobium]|uniref:PAS domain-containing protein n=1 Tax=unclassified Rhizobium TaxID=2613769 RepID=UPI001ADAA994|nr:MULTISPECIES: PAS domain-containing protein [unclassified Rhizobium]MBO9127852.1 PAS domain-containing protein [Rhizobium sp. 16-488-2b]MBO9175140.1 PAS domain-containing protein [Rhizobium sp. 16-488-2a]